MVSDAIYTHKIKFRMAMATVAFNKKKSFCHQTGHKFLRKKLIKCYIWSIVFYGAETCTRQKYVESSEMWC